MKVMLTTLLFLSMQATLSNAHTYSYGDDRFKIQKVVMDQEILINDLIKIYHVFEGERMIAGKFEVKESLSEKKSYLNGLRSKLEQSKIQVRF